MDFVTKDEIKAVLERLKAWLTSALGGKANKNGSSSEGFSADTLTANMVVVNGTSGAECELSYSGVGANTNSLVLPSKSGTLATTSDIDEAVFTTFAGMFGVTSISSSTTIASDNNKTVFHINSSSDCTVTLPAVSGKMGRGFIFIHAQTSSGTAKNYTIQAAGSTKLCKAGEYYSSQASRPTSVVLNTKGKAIFVYAPSNAVWYYFEI